MRLSPMRSSMLGRSIGLLGSRAAVGIWGMRAGNGSGLIDNFGDISEIASLMKAW
ncbi:MAG: hypothetical protein O2921_04005 [Chloroflexi bacterium]|nr:hypothetical protein [Chloroflexota bacterium]MDA1281774.1 hypothetical protein [Chloroflexota bacterium]